MNKPPLGLMPKYVWDEVRLNDFRNEIIKRVESGVEINTKWIEEYNQLLERKTLEKNVIVKACVDQLYEDFVKEIGIILFKDRGYKLHHTINVDVNAIEGYQHEKVALEIRDKVYARLSQTFKIDLSKVLEQFKIEINFVGG